MAELNEQMLRAIIMDIMDEVGSSRMSLFRRHRKKNLK